MLNPVTLHVERISTQEADLSRRVTLNEVKDLCLNHFTFEKMQTAGILHFCRVKLLFGITNFSSTFYTREEEKLERKLRVHSNSLRSLAR